MHHHQAHPQTGEQVDVVGQLEKFAIAHHVTTKSNDKSSPTKRMNIRRGLAEPFNKISGMHRLKKVGVKTARIVTPHGLMCWNYSVRKDCKKEGAQGKQNASPST